MKKPSSKKRASTKKIEIDLTIRSKKKKLFKKSLKKFEGEQRLLKLSRELASDYKKDIKLLLADEQMQNDFLDWQENRLPEKVKQLKASGLPLPNILMELEKNYYFLFLQALNSPNRRSHARLVQKMAFIEKLLSKSDAFKAFRKKHFQKGE